LEQPNVFLSFNSQRTNDDFAKYFEAMHPDWSHKHLKNRLVFLPNYYPVGKLSVPYRLDCKDTIDIGCFGAIRPMKNQLLQAMAAIEFSRESGYNLRYHINAPRVEQAGDSALKNIRALFAGLDETYELVEHDWMEHHEFIHLVRQMDIGLQVSFSETFNIVAADLVSNGVPVVGSEEIPFLFKLFQADMTDSADIVKRMGLALRWKRLFGCFDPNKMGLNKYARKAEHVWVDYLSRFECDE
jgi:glycosyltransferase involved in cell wall biosynthesis